jgi:hypothetical protein
MVRFAIAGLCAGTLALGGCVVVPPPGPTILAAPGPGKTFTQFQQDDITCRQYAVQQTGYVSPAEAATQSGVNSAALGTVLGAAVGALLGAAGGDPGAGAAFGAGSGLLLGGASGTGAAQVSGAAVQQRYDVSYLQCMSARGDTVPRRYSYYYYPSYY